MSTQQIRPLGNVPAGYECERSALIASGAIFTSKWLVPAGKPVYAHVALAHIGEEKEEQFWERLIEYVSLYVRMRDQQMASFENGAATFKGAALSDKPPTMEIDYAQVQLAEPRGLFLEGEPALDGSFNLVPAGVKSGPAV